MFLTVTISPCQQCSGENIPRMLITSEQWLQIDLLEQSSDESVKSTRLSAEHRYNGKVQLTEI